MLLRLIGEVTAERGEVAKPDESFVVSLPLGGTATFEVRDDRLELILEMAIEAAALTSRHIPGASKPTVDGIPGPWAVATLGAHDAGRLAIARDVVHALGFLLNMPLKLSASSVALLPEGDEDTSCLESIGSSEVDQGDPSGLANIRTFGSEFTDEDVAYLLGHRPGLRLYNDALRANSSSSRFIALWRIVESAFARANSRLIDLVLAYEPAKTMKFDRDELKALLALRGRAAHAQSRAGLDEIVAVEAACEDRARRLTSLVEQLLLTKRTWGTKSLAFDQRLRLTSYVGRDHLVIFKPDAPAEGGNRPG